MDYLLKYRFQILGGIIIMFVTFFSGYSYGSFAKDAEYKQLASIVNKDGLGIDKKPNDVDFTPFWKAWEVINEKYVPTNSTTTDKTGDQDRVYGAIEGMVKSLGDPYTTFFPPAETKEFNEAISGQIEGVGMEVGIKDGILTVIAPVKNTPAYKAGIKAGDQVLLINELSTQGLSSEEAISHIRGKKGTSVKLTMLHAGAKEPYVVDIVRDVINMPTVDTETRNGVFIIRLYSFSAISPELFRNALREFYESGTNKLIIDLRGNPGGYLEAAQEMAGWFLPMGKVIVTEDFRNEKDRIVFRSKGPNPFENINIVVLIDGGSASASEILAGALHDHGVATLVGTKSFGKGSVQELVDITDKTSLKVTIARWLTPNGISISHNGLVPDVEVKLDEKKYLENKTDTQLDKAIEILNQ